MTSHGAPWLGLFCEDIKPNENHAITIWSKWSQTKQESCGNESRDDDTCCEEFYAESCDNTYCEGSCDKNKINEKEKNKQRIT